jgi:hypothetical protein
VLGIDAVVAGAEVAYAGDDVVVLVGGEGVEACGDGGAEDGEEDDRDGDECEVREMAGPARAHFWGVGTVRRRLQWRHRLLAREPRPGRSALEIGEMLHGKERKSEGFCCGVAIRFVRR